MDIGLIAGQAGQALLAIDILNCDDTPDLEMEDVDADWAAAIRVSIVPSGKG